MRYQIRITRVLAQPGGTMLVLCLSPASLKHEHPAGATCRAGLEPRGGRRLLEGKTKLSEPLTDLKNPKCCFAPVQNAASIRDRELEAAFSLLALS